MHSDSPGEFLLSGPPDKKRLTKGEGDSGKWGLQMVFQRTLSTARFWEIIWEESAVMSRLQQKHLILNNFSNILHSTSQNKKLREKRQFSKDFSGFFCTFASLEITQTVVWNGPTQVLQNSMQTLGKSEASKRRSSSPLTEPPPLLFRILSMSPHHHCLLSNTSIPSLRHTASFLQKRRMSMKTHPLPVLSLLCAIRFSFLNDSSFHITLLFKTCVNLPNSLAWTSALPSWSIYCFYMCLGISLLQVCSQHSLSLKCLSPLCPHSCPKPYPSVKIRLKLHFLQKAFLASATKIPCPSSTLSS